MNSVLDRMWSAVFLIGESGRFEYVNKKACRVLGYGSDEFLTMTVADIDPDINLKGWPEQWQERKTQGQCVFESRHQTKDGRVYLVEICSTYFEHDGQGYLLSLASDINERKPREDIHARGERDFCTLAENFPGPIARHDRQGRLLFLNQNFSDLLGAVLSEVYGRTTPAVNPDGSFADYHARLVEAMETDKTSDLEIATPRGKEGDMLLVRFVPEYDVNGQVIGGLVIGRDITDSKLAQARIECQDAELSACNSAIKVLLEHSRKIELELQENMLASVNRLLNPYLEQAANAVAGNETASAAIKLVQESIKNLISPFAKRLSAPSLGLSPRELQLADLIKKGYSTKEIATRLFLAAGTVEFYRDRLRSKLKIKGKKDNLRTCLLSLAGK